MVIPFDVLPDEPNTFSYPPGGVTVELPAGTVNQPTEFLYTFLEVDSVPARLEGFTLTDRVFDLSLVGKDGRTLEGPVTLGQPIKVSVRIDTRWEDWYSLLQSCLPNRCLQASVWFAGRRASPAKVLRGGRFYLCTGRFLFPCRSLRCNNA